MTPSLVDALEEETEIQAQPLPLDRIVPWRRVWAVAALAAAPVLFLSGRRGSQRRVANRARARLAEPPAVHDALGRAGEPHGRPGGERADRRGVARAAQSRRRALYPAAQGSRTPPGRPPRSTVPDRGPASKREVKLEKVEKPLDYRVAAGPASSPTYRIEVRYPLALKSFDVALKPPAYTGVEPSTVKGGDLRVIEGTDATFQITFDSPPAEASLVMTDPSVRSRKDKTPPAPRVIPLKSDGTTYTAGLNLTKGLVYQIEARTADGRATAQEHVTRSRSSKIARRAWRSSSPTRRWRSIRSPRS